jgi:hypothetical protein
MPLTIEVDIDHGRIVAREPEKLPEKGKGFLTVTESLDENAPGTLSPLQALEALQKYLKLDQKKADEWIATTREARR